MYQNIYSPMPRCIEQNDDISKQGAYDYDSDNCVACKRIASRSLLLIDMLVC